MSLKLYNTYSKKKETLKPLNPPQVTIYNCGPTVYDFVHIGNLSAYLMADLVRRYLEYKGFKVKQIMNITDVGHLVSDEDSGEDKILKGAKRENKTPQEIANFYTQAFYQDLEKLNIKKAYKYPKATEHIAEMIAIIKKLLEINIAYEKNGSVYFDISKFNNYGKLSGNTKEKLEELVKGARSEIVQDKNKKNPFDFALWLKAPENHLMKWKSPWSVGYPGWHIECSAMSTKYLGESIDIHTGGEDNVFPHHENEIAQSESLTNKKFVQIWMHKRYLLVNNQKMSKSKGNFYKLEDIEKSGFNPLDFRYLVLQSHYRSQINFSENALKQAHQSLERINDFISRLKSVNDTENNTNISATINKTKEKIEKHLDNDLDTPQALASLFELISTVNKFIDHDKISTADSTKIIGFISKIDQIFGLKLTNKDKDDKTPANKKEVEKLIRQREEARNNKDWIQADKIREKLLKLGVEIKDTKEGTTWKMIS